MPLDFVGGVVRRQFYIQHSHFTDIDFRLSSRDLCGLCRLSDRHLTLGNQITVGFAIDNAAAHPHGCHNAVVVHRCHCFIGGTPDTLVCCLGRIGRKDNRIELIGVAAIEKKLFDVYAQKLRFGQHCHFALRRHTVRSRGVYHCTAKGNTLDLSF